MVPTPALPRLDADALRHLADAATSAAPPADPPCPTCAALVCPGWDSLPGSFDREALQPVGTLRDAADDEPTLAEHHPAGTHGWSADAPIALHWCPYNRCTVWTCRACGRPFLRYTEYGGYYEDERIRALSAALVDDTPAGA